MEEKAIHPDLISAVLDWLGYDGVSFFEMCLDEYDKINATWMIILPGTHKFTPLIKAIRIAQGRYAIPHTVHFREGMNVRNFMRGSGYCKGWTDHDFDNHWVEVVEKALILCEKLSMKKI